jgi:hypothetical protein
MPVRIANIVLAALAAALVPAAAAAAAEALPQNMQAAAIDAAGDAHALTPHQLPVPHPGPTEVLIAIHTAGVASWDVELRRHPEQIKNGRFPSSSAPMARARRRPGYERARLQSGRRGLFLQLGQSPGRLTPSTWRCRPSASGTCRTG